MPDLTRALPQGNMSDLMLALDIEQAEYRLVSMFREQGEINAFAVPSRTQWIRLARPNGHGGFIHQSPNSKKNTSFADWVKP